VLSNKVNMNQKAVLMRPHVSEILFI
jgi:hypothetical protein